MSHSKKVSRMLHKLNEDGWHYGGLPGLQWEAENARKAEGGIAKQVVEELYNDVRFEEFYHACINCGNCTSKCPPFRLVDFEPRIVVQKVMHAKDEPELLYQMMDQYIWACFQCYSCWEVCPAHNNPGGLVAILKEIAVRHGLNSAKKALEPYSKILYKVMTTGTQITPDMHITIALFKDWGPHKAELAKNIRAERAGVPVETMAGVMDKSWKVDEGTMKELMFIEKEAGVFDSVEKTLKDVTDMVRDTAKEAGVE
ncbi:MAG: 4Fe-4S dicluster domain-containing protein [Conexivisphaerales archaeon]